MGLTPVGVRDLPITTTSSSSNNSNTTRGAHRSALTATTRRTCEPQELTSPPVFKGTRGRLERIVFRLQVKALSVCHSVHTCPLSLTWKARKTGFKFFWASSERIDYSTARSQAVFMRQGKASENGMRIGCIRVGMVIRVYACTLVIF